MEKLSAPANGGTQGWQSSLRLAQLDEKPYLPYPCWILIGCDAKPLRHSSNLVLLSDKSRLRRPWTTISLVVRQTVIGQNAHGRFGSKHSPVPGVSDWSDFSDAAPCRGTALPPPDWPRVGYEGGATHTSHPFTVGRPRVRKEPREPAEGAGNERRGGLGGGAGRAEVTAGEARLDLPASFHRVGPSGGGSPPPPARRRGAEPDSGEATLAASGLGSRARGALSCRRLSPGSAPRLGERADTSRCRWFTLSCC